MVQRGAYAGLAIASLVTGCAQFRPPAAGAEAASEGGADPCAKRALIEDGEDGDDQIARRGGRGGYLYTYADDKGSTVAKGEIKPVGGGANGSDFALHLEGQLAQAEDVSAGIGFSFQDPTAPYDASAWKGVAFFARGPAAGAFVRVKLPDAATAPEGKQCTECFNDFGVDFQVTDKWTRYEVAFADLQQQPDWGVPRPAAIDVTKVYGLQWQVATPGAAVDLWIDDVTFVGCPADGQREAGKE